MESRVTRQISQLALLARRRHKRKNNEGKLTHYASKATCHISQRRNECSFVDTQGKLHGK